MSDETNLPTEQESSTTPSEDSNVDGLKKKNFELIGKLKELQKILVEKEAESDLVSQILGTKDPEALRRLKEEQARAKQLDETIAQKISEQTSLLKNDYEQRLAAERSEREQKENQVKSMLQDECLRKLFASCGGRDYEDFKALVKNKLKINYAETGVNNDGIPRYEIESITDLKGTSIYFGGKEPAKPQEILLKIRQGDADYSTTAIKATFEPWNQSSGGGLPAGTVNGRGVTSYHSSERMRLQANDRDGAIAAKIAKGEIVFYD